MKTREIECWIVPDINGCVDDLWWSKEEVPELVDWAEKRLTKATLSWKEPEREIKLTESQFEILVGDFVGMIDGRGVKNALDTKDIWKQKLFGKEEIG